MKFSKFFSRIVLVLASISTAMQPVLAQSTGTFKTRVPLSISAINPNLTAINLGAAPVGVTQQTSTYFTNSTGSDLVLTSGSFSATGGAQLVNTTCVGTVAAGSSCAMTVALAVPSTGPVSGTVSVATGNPAGPDAIVISATGLQGAPGLVSSPPLVDFGMQGVNQGAGPAQTITISNTGAAAADITAIVSLSSSFLVDPTGCNLVLVPGDSCTISAKFAPRSLGTLNTNLRATLADGTTVPLTALTGTGVQGVPKWIVPPTFQFYDMTVGQVSADRAVTLQNIGKGDLKVVSLSVQGDTSFTLVSTTCPIGGMLAPDATCTVVVHAKVMDSNAHNANIVLTSSQSSSPTTKVPLTARALYSQAIAFPTSLDFGDIPAGQTVTQTVTLFNPGTLPFTVTAISADAPFTVSGDCLTTLQPLGSCTLNVSITSSQAGAVVGTVSISTDATVSGNPTIALSANVVAPSFVTSFDVSASSLNFGGVYTGTSKSLTLSVLNTGTQSLTLDSITSTGAYSAVHNCSATMPGSSCEVTVTFAPLVAGVATGTLALTADGVVRNVALTGTGLTAVFVTDIKHLDFGNVTIGQTATQTLTFTNQGTAPASPTISFGAEGYTVTSTTCGAVLNAGDTCTMDVTFAPTAAKQYLDVLTILGATTGAVLVDMTGVGVVPLFSNFDVNPTSVDFGSIPVGTPVTVNIAVLNSGTKILNLVAPVSSAPQFTTVDNCSSVAANDICIVSITFLPTASGPVTGTLTLNDGGAVTRTVQLSGAGTQAQLTVDASSLNYGDVVIGQTVTKTVTISNTGNLDAPLGVMTNSVYTVTGSTCPAVLAAGATCTVSVTFSPVVVGSFPGTLTLTGSADGAKTVALTGTGTPIPIPVPHWTLSTTSLDFGTVLAGSTTSKTVQILNDGETNLPSFDSLIAGDGYVSANGCVAVSLSPGQSCNITVSFNPLNSGLTYPGVLTIVQGASLVDVSLTGQVLDVPNLTLAGIGDYDVFNIAIDAPSPHTFTLTNTSVSTSITGIAFNISTLTTQTFYRKAGSDQCTGTTLAPGASCSVVVVFKPTAAGQFNQLFSASSVQGATASIPLTGRGGAPVWDVSPQTLNFGTILTGSTYSQTVVVKNTGTTVSVPSISGSSSNPRYTVDASRCANILPGWSCTVDVTYNPDVAGAPTLITDSGVITLTGNSVTRTIAVTGKSGIVNFTSSFFEDTGSVVGSVVPVLVSFKNEGTLPADVTATTSVADGYSFFGGSINPQELPHCTAVQPQASCSAIVHVRVTDTYVEFVIPMTAHYYDAVSGQSEDIPQTGFYGFVLASSSVVLGSTALAYGEVTIGTSLTRDVIVTNQTNQPLNLTFTVSGANEFTVTHNCRDVPAGGTCRIQAKFAPQTVAAFHGAISVDFGTGDALRTITMDGVGAPGKILQVTYLGVPKGTTAYESTQLSSDGALVLGSVVMGSTGSVDTYTTVVTNLSALPLSLTTGPVDTGTSGATSTCGVILSAGASCSKTFHVGTSAQGGVVTQLNFNYLTPANGKVSAAVPVYYSLTPPYSLSGADFGTLQAGQSSTRTIILTNHTSQVSSIALTMPSSSFTASAFSGYCAGGQTIAAASSCSFNLTFQPTSADFSSLRFGNLVVTGTYGVVSAAVTAATYTPPAAPVVTPGNPSGTPTNPVLDIRVVTNSQMNPVMYGDQGHYFSSYDAPCNNGSLYSGYMAMDVCMLNKIKDSLVPTYGAGVSCMGFQSAGPYPYFSSWGYLCRN